jgi:O-methyltransferase/aklanonic acid methyltransferase
VVAPVWRETCSYCGDVSTTPEEIKAGTAGGFGRAASTYDTVIPFFETFARYLVEVAAPNPGDRVMDVACGRGACLRVAAEDVGSSGYVLGVDLSRAMIDIAGEDLARLKLAASVEVRVGDAEHLDLPDDCFDVVVCGFGVSFFPDPGAALSEVRRVLRDGGRFAGSTFVGSGGGYPWIGEVLHAIRPTAVMPPRSPVATAAGLTEFLQRAGFVDATTREVEARFIFPDLDAYLAWNWSTGQRRLLESLNDQEADAYRHESAMRIEDHAVAGGYELIQTAAMTVATKPKTAPD